MALSPTNNAALLQDVDEAVRKDEMIAFMNRYGRWIAAAVLGALLAFGGYLYWGHRQSNLNGAQAEKLSIAMDQLESGQSAEAAKALKALAAEGTPAYRAAALIEQANIAASEGKLKEGAALLGQVAADTKLDQSLRDMALIRQTALEFDGLKAEAVIARMKPIMDAKDPQSSWFASAAELTAVAHYQLGQMDQAGALFGRIAKLDGVAPSLKSRAMQMAGMLGVDAVEDAAAKDKKAEQAASKTEDSK